MIQIVKPSTAASFPAGHRVDCSDSPRLPSARRGRLKNGNPSGDFLAAPRCGAHTRCGGECRQPAMRSGRCRLHGGLSTGPHTPGGLARSRRARWKHGARSAEVTALRAARAQLRRVRALLAGTLRTAGHGVHRSHPAATSRVPRAKVNRRDAEAPRYGVSGTRRTIAMPSFSREHSSRHHALPNGVARPNLPDLASLRLCVSAVHLPSSAGHGVHRPNSQPQPAGPALPSRREHLRSSASIRGLNYVPPAGHGVHRSIHDTAPLHRRPV